jgi:hypothetical protein
MKNKEEIEKLANELIGVTFCGHINITDELKEFYINGYTQCEEDNDWTKNCECKSSIGQTWCCNKCGLPYDTRKSKYTSQSHEDNKQILLDFIKWADAMNGYDNKLDEIDVDTFLNKQENEK